MARESVLGDGIKLWRTKFLFERKGLGIESVFIFTMRLPCRGRVCWWLNDNYVVNWARRAAPTGG